MAIFHFEVSIVGRSAGRSAVAAAAYRSGQVLRDRRHGRVRRPGVRRDPLHLEILLPEGAPAWMADREALWNAVEAAERRKDSQLARQIVVVLPRELSPQRQVGLARGFAAALAARGMVADLAVHPTAPGRAEPNPHALLLLTMRRVDPAAPGGFGPKETAWNGRGLVLELRGLWAGLLNAALAEAGLAGRVDPRSFAARRAEALAAGDLALAARLDRVPEPRVGAAATALERRGVRTGRGDAAHRARRLAKASQEALEGF